MFSTTFPLNLATQDIGVLLPCKFVSALWYSVFAGLAAIIFGVNIKKTALSSSRH
jgi:hypothetical protein